MYCIRPDPLRASKRVWLRETTSCPDTIFIDFSRFLTRGDFRKTFHSKVMASFTYRKLTAITTTLLRMLPPMILLLTAYVLVVALRPAVHQKLPRMLVRVPSEY